LIKNQVLQIGQENYFVKKLTESFQPDSKLKCYRVSGKRDNHCILIIIQLNLVP